MTFNSDERFKAEAESLLEGILPIDQVEAPSNLRAGAMQFAQFVSAYIGAGFSREESIYITLKFMEMNMPGANEHG